MSAPTTTKPPKADEKPMLAAALPALTFSKGPPSNVRGWRVTLPTSPDLQVKALADELRKAPREPGAWWSPLTWEPDTRKKDTWEAAAAIAVDLDFGAMVWDVATGRELQKHTEAPQESREALERAGLPGCLFHHTPRGARLVFVLQPPITDPDEYERAYAGACEVSRRVLECAGLLAGRDKAGYAADPATDDLARCFYTPCALVDGKQRNAAVEVLRQDPYTAAELAQLAPPPPQKPKPSPPRNPSACTEVQDAVEAFNADHPGDWPRSGGECPACGHKGCFNAHPNNPDRWCCHSSNHGGCGLPPAPGKGCWTGDALDLEAFARGVERLEVLRRNGYLLRNGTAPQVAAQASEADRRAGVVPPGGTFIVEGEQIALADRAMAELAAAVEPGVFIRARRLVRVSRAPRRKIRGLARPAGAPVIELLTPDALRDRLARLGVWLRRRGKNDADTMPPEWLVQNIFARELAAWPFEQLESVIEAPTMRADGSILEVPGFDEATGLLYAPGADFPPVPAAPTPEDVTAALLELLDPLMDFPFRTPSDQYAAVAAKLSLVARHAIEGPVPLFAFRSPTPGTGKGLLADEVAIVGTGRSAARMILPDDNSETRKLILAVAIEGAPVVLLDNVDRRLSSQALAAALTADTWAGRLLGVSEIVTAPLHAVWLATGNNLGFRGDLGRRVVPVDLDADMEHPEDRDQFRHPDLRAYVEQRRPKLVVAALTVLRAYHLAGRPRHGAPRMGSYEAWDDLIRGACVWALHGDPVGGRERIRQEQDEDRLALRGALEALADTFGPDGFTATEVVERAEHAPELAAALLELAPGRAGKLDTRSLGYALRNARDRWVNGRRFVQDGRKGKTGTPWRVEAR